LAAPFGAGLLTAACVLALGSGAALAQLASPDDPLTPKLQSDPRKPPRFQPANQPTLTQFAAPATFAPPPSAAGNTGFDSSNANKAKANAAAKSRAKP
jgi:hypothetical protein